MPDTITMPCRPELIGTARHAVRALLADTPAADDAETITSEFVTNSVLWSASRNDGTIEIALYYEPGANTARIEVIDAGPLRNPERPDDPEQHGRGLVIVAALAAKWGHDVISGKREMWWAELAW